MKKIYMYAPWSVENFNKLTTEATEKLTVLDIEFGGMCNLNCIYCDTPKYDAPCSINLDAIETILNTGTISYVYVCGLGEPTVKGNIEIFKLLLKMCDEKGIKVSIFSNMVNLDEELFYYIKKGTLNVLFKLDSFKPEIINYLYGTEKSTVILNNYNRLKEAVYISGNTTNLGASIVISEKNYEEIFEIIDWCITNKIYPFLGPLEKAGKCSKIFDNLEISEKKLLKIREYIQSKYGEAYNIPLCPVNIAGIHITNDNRVMVDKKTGLSCGWFWKDDPQMIEVGNLSKMCLEEITEKILKYRQLKIKDVIEIEKNLTFKQIESCGGDVKVLLRKYQELL